jgi:hypothetical protein
MVYRCEGRQKNERKAALQDCSVHYILIIEGRVEGAKREKVEEQVWMEGGANTSRCR